MTRKEQIKILDDKIKSNDNQYITDRLNAEISAFSDGDLNKYEFLTRKDLKYKPNALDKARFEFSPLRRAFNEGLDKTVANYQEEGVIKLLKDIRDGLARNGNDGNEGNDGNDGNDGNILNELGLDSIAKLSNKEINKLFNDIKNTVENTRAFKKLGLDPILKLSNKERNRLFKSKSINTDETEDYDKIQEY